jgi:hypothetical protein
MRSGLNRRATGALWGLFIGDALSMPVHWYYDREALSEDALHLPAKNPCFFKGNPDVLVDIRWWAHRQTREKPILSRTCSAGHPLARGRFRIGEKNSRTVRQKAGKAII